jgi:hypothetical protein
MQVIVIKGLKRSEKVSGKHSINYTQKSAILGTSHAIEKCYNLRHSISNCGAHHCLKRRSARAKTAIRKKKETIMTVITIRMVTHS